MDKRKKLIIWLLLFVFVLVSMVFVVTYAYIQAREERKGNFTVDVTSNGVDTLYFNNTQDVEMSVNSLNFDEAFGHNVSNETILSATLETTNFKSNTYCYELSVKLPDEVVFNYNVVGKPELVMSVQSSLDGINYTNLIENLDITTKTGIVKVPNSLDGSEYQFSISTTKNKTINNYYKLTLTMLYYKDINQTSNFDKSYHAEFNVNRVEC